MTTFTDATTPSLWDQHHLTLTLTARPREMLPAVVQAGWCPLEHPVVELGLNAPGVRTFALIPAMGMGIRGSLVIHEADVTYGHETLAEWLNTLIERHRQFEDATMQTLCANPYDEVNSDVD